MCLFLIAIGSIDIQNAETPDELHIVVSQRAKTKISPYIYGINYPDTWLSDWLKEWDGYHTGFTLAREGGNRFTAYNWETNASNAGNDYFFENDDYLGASNDPGWTVKQFLDHVQPSGAVALITVPTIGYVAADKDNNRDGGKDVNHTPDYLEKRFFKSVAVKPGGHLSYPPNTSDKAVYQDEFVNWVTDTASKSSPVWFSLDNEPDLWSGTHARICPVEPGYSDIFHNNIEYASMIKHVAPKSLVFGPVNYGYNGFRTFQGAKDGNGRVFVDAYLDAMRDASRTVGRRILDAYDFHWYPEATGDGIRICYSSTPDKPGTEEARIQAPRSLWDATYVEKSWITDSNGHQPIALIPDMEKRVAAHFPSTKLSISEYDFGSRKSISGALAQADALGVFGRYGLFAACHWGLTHGDIGAFAGFEAFSNFDRHGSSFGDLGLSVTGEDPAKESVYASVDSKDSHRLTIVAIDKTQAEELIHVRLPGFKARQCEGYLVDRDHFESPVEVQPTITAEGVDIVLPGRSIFTVVLLSK